MKLLAIIGGLLAAVVGLHYSFRKEYTVHSSGVILVTGASSGIGKDAAVRLAGLGFFVFAGVRKQSDAEAILSANIEGLTPIIVDVTKHDECVNAINTASRYAEEHGTYFVGLVNNAGISRRNIAEFHSVDDARVVFETNVFGLIDITQLALPHLRKSQGRIVMLSSIAGFFAPPGSSIYAASKFAVEGFSDALRREIANFGISVSIVQPGYVATNIFEKSELRIELGDANTAAPETIVALYPGLTSNASVAKRLGALEKAESTECTSDAISHAMTARFPRTRYPVSNAFGFSATLISYLSSYLSDSTIDAVFMRV